MTTELITSPPAAGKTYHCIQRIQSLRRANPLASIWVIVPDRWQAKAFRRRLSDAGGVLGTQVGRFEDLYTRIMEECGNFTSTASPALLHRLIQEAVDNTVEKGELLQYAPLQVFPGFIVALRESFAELKRSMVSPQQLTDQTRSGTDSLRDLALLYRRYHTGLQDLNWIDPEDLGWLAISSLQGNPEAASGISLLVVDGFDSFDNIQYQVMHLLGTQVGDLLVTLPGEKGSARSAHRRFTDGIERVVGELGARVTHLSTPPQLPAHLVHVEGHLFEAEEPPRVSTPQPVLLEARTPAEEAREALRWIKQRVIRDGVPLSSCVIFTPNPEVYNPLLRLCADEMGVPIHFTLDEPLQHSPAITALLNLLSLPGKKYNSHYLINTLRSPYFDLHLEPETVDVLEIVSRVAQVVEGRQQWQEAWERLADSTPLEKNDLDDERNSPPLPRGKEAEALREVLEDVFQKIVPPDGVRTHAEWIAWMDGMLEVLDFRQKIVSPRDRSAYGEFRETLRALVFSEGVVGERRVEYASFLADLQGTLLRERFREPSLPGQPVLLIGRMLEARGTRFQAVALLGFSEGIFPINEHADPFLPEELRAALGMESRLHRDQAGLFYQAFTRTDHYLLITRPYMADDGDDLAPSAYWKAVAALLTKESIIKVNPEVPRPLSEAASTQELLFTAARGQGLSDVHGFLDERWRDLQYAREVMRARRSRQIGGSFEGIVETITDRINTRYSPERVWSPSQLETYGNCPFYFYVSKALELELHEPPSLGIEVNQLGSMLHKILEETYRKAEISTNLESVLQSLRTQADAVFSDAPRKFGFRPSALWEIEKRQFLAKLEVSVSKLMEDTEWTPLVFEARFGIDAQPPLVIQLEKETIKLRGVIDRVDRNASGELRVIDYKTGSTQISASDLDEGSHLQLPLYALAARDALGMGEPVEGLYWQILAARSTSLKLGSYKGEDSRGVEAAIHTVCQQLQRILDGIHATKFAPQPPEDGCSEFCPAIQWCWRYEPRR